MIETGNSQILVEREQEMRIIILVSLIIGMSIPASAVGQNPSIEVGCGAVIEAPGKYRIASDLYCSIPAPVTPAIKIASSDVDLDLSGHSITCDGFQPGIYVVGDGPLSNISITNGRVSGCSAGVVLGEVSGSKVSQMETSGNLRHGIFVAFSNDNRIVGNQAIENEGSGIVLVASNGNEIKGNDVSYNQNVGIALLAYFFFDNLLASNGNQILGNNAVGNGLSGIALEGPSTGNVIKGNTAQSNLDNGIIVYGFDLPDGTPLTPIGAGNGIQGNTASGNAQLDLVEAFISIDTLEISRVGAECQNDWKSNDFQSLVGPLNCIQ